MLPRVPTKMGQGPFVRLQKLGQPLISTGVYDKDALVWITSEIGCSTMSNNPTVLWQGGSMHAMHTIARVHESINQPIPIVGGFHGDPPHHGPIGLQCREDHRKVVAQPLLIQQPVRVITGHEHTVRGMKIDSDMPSHRNRIGVGG